MNATRSLTAFDDWNDDRRVPVPSHAWLSTCVPLQIHAEVVLGWRRGRLRGHRVLSVAGHIRLRGMRLEIAFRRPAEGAGRGREQRVAAVVVPAGHAIPVPLQYVSQPQDEENDVWVLTAAPERQPPWNEHYAGQLEGDGLTVDRHVPVRATLQAGFISEECQDGRGTKVELGGELRFDEATHMRVLFRDPGRSVAPPSEADSDETLLIAAGTRVPFELQTVSGMVGPHPWISVRVVDDAGRSLTAESLLGRSGGAS